MTHEEFVLNVMAGMGMLYLIMGTWFIMSAFVKSRKKKD